MTLSDYIIFTTVSELKNMSLASDKLYLTRSAISHAISRIEREIGFPLFIKIRTESNLQTTELTFFPLHTLLYKATSISMKKSQRSMDWLLAMSALEPAPASALTGYLNL